MLFKSTNEKEEWRKKFKEKGGERNTGQNLTHYKKTRGKIAIKIYNKRSLNKTNQNLDPVLVI